VTAAPVRRGSALGVHAHGCHAFFRRWRVRTLWAVVTVAVCARFRSAHSGCMRNTGRGTCSHRCNKGHMAHGCPICGAGDGHVPWRRGSLLPRLKPIEMEHEQPQTQAGRLIGRLSGASQLDVSAALRCTPMGRRAGCACCGHAGGRGRLDVPGAVRL